MSLKVISWNVEWATPASRRTAEVLNRIARHAPDVVCLTEAHVELLSGHGHFICSQPDYGYTTKEGRRKVMLWSKEPWEQIDDLGIDSMSPGRFVAGVTQTSLGAVKIVGVCIPWFGSRTEAKRKLGRKKQWEDHRQYLLGLTEILARASVTPLIVLGDFNQTIGPDSRAPSELQLALQRAFPSSMTVATTALAFQGRRSIDHITPSDDLTVKSLDVISNLHDGGRLSDHFGVVAELSSRHSPEA